MSSLSSPFTNLVESSNPWQTNYNDNEVTVLKTLIDKACKSGYVTLKKCIRNLSLPPSHPLRAGLWLKLLSVKYSTNVQVSDSDIQNSNTPLTNATNIDDATSMAGYEFSNQMLLPTFFLNQLGQKYLRTILHNIYIERPELVYAPQLWPLTALFLHYMPITTAHKCILILLDQPGVLIQTKSTWKEHCLALEELAYLYKLLRRGNKKRRESLVMTTMKTALGLNENNNNNSNNSSMSKIEGMQLQLARWCLLLWQLPFDRLVCLVDSFLLEGPKVFYRAGIVILKACLSGKYTELGDVNKLGKNIDDATQSLGRFEDAFKHIPLTPAKLKQKMFAFPTFSRAKIAQAIKNTHFQEVSFDIDKELIQICDTNKRNTFAAYLLNDKEKVTHPSECISSKELAAIITSIEDHKLSQLSKPYLVFSSNIDGNSLRTFYAKAGETANPATILLIRSSSKHSVIGAFCSERWQPRVESGYYGNGLCFLFRIQPGPLTIHRWIGSTTNDPAIMNSPRYLRFQRATNNGIEIGGGGGGGSMKNDLPGISLDSCLTMASSGPTETFSNPCLITDPTDLTQTVQCGNGQIGCLFTVGLVELIGFTDL
ncbi:unnamed protein product [Trichobilharzia szidati]|nr:unnamed protein product [Trichobilharzia szidati]